MTAPATGARYDGHVVRRRGYTVVGADVSADRFRLARSRLSVVRADGGALPLRDGVAQLAVAVLAHTDVDDYGTVVTESVRVLAPGGCFVHVGVHPCFVSPAAERLADGVRIHPGYRTVGRQQRTRARATPSEAGWASTTCRCRTC